MRDRLALWCIRAARRLTTWGWVDDHLEMAEREQEAHMRAPEPCIPPDETPAQLAERQRREGAGRADIGATILEPPAHWTREQSDEYVRLVAEHLRGRP